MMQTQPAMTSEIAARLFKCLSESLRLRLVAVLAREELNVNELTGVLQVPQSTLSRHLAVLREADLLTTRRQGTMGYYRLAADRASGSTAEMVRLVRQLLQDDASAADDLRRLEDVLDERRRAVRTYFDSAGQSWDELHRAVADPAVKSKAIQRLLPAGLVLVDAGCGTGWLLPELAATGARVIAVDNSPNQLRKAEANVRELGLGNVEFREGDLGALPLEDGAADGVFAHLTLHHIPRPEVAIRDMVRVLKPGASLVVTDFVTHDEAWLQAEHADLWPGFDPADVGTWMRDAGLVGLRNDETPYAVPKSKTPGHSVAGLRLFIQSGTKPPVPSNRSSS